MPVADALQRLNTRAAQRELFGGGGPKCLHTRCSRGATRRQTGRSRRAHRRLDKGGGARGHAADVRSILCPAALSSLRRVDGRKERAAVQRGGKVAPHGALVPCIEVESKGIFLDDLVSRLRVHGGRVGCARLRETEG